MAYGKIVFRRTGQGGGGVNVTRSPGVGALGASGRSLTRINSGESGSLALLTPDDFTLDGHFDIPRSGYVGGYGDLAYSSGYTGRVVAGDPRLIIPMNLGGGTWAIEMSLGSLTLNAYNPSPTVVHSWDGATMFSGAAPPGPSASYYGAFWLDPADNTTLWHTWHPFLSSPSGLSGISKRTLHDDDTVSDIQNVSLSGVDQALIGTGFQRLPAWFQAAYSCGPILVGWGGGAYEQSAPQSPGLFAVALPDFDGYSDGDTISSPTFKRAADFTSGDRTTDWWNDGSGRTTPNAFDRGQRLAGYHYDFLNGGNAFSPTHGGFGWADVDGTTLTWSRTYTPGWDITTSADSLRWFTIGMPSVVSSSGTSIQLGPDAASTDIYYAPYGANAAFICITSGAGKTGADGSGPYYIISGYNPTTKILTVTETVAGPLDGTSTCDIGRLPDPPWWGLDVGQDWWPGADFIQNSVAVPKIGTAYVSGPTTLQPCTVASRDKFWKMTLHETLPVTVGAMFLTPNIDPPVHRDDRMNWTTGLNPDGGGPDGFNRFARTDGYLSTPQYIEGPNKHGFVCLGNFTAGNIFKSNFHVASTTSMCEMHIFDPVTLGQVLTGVKQGWQAQPTYMSATVMSEITDTIQAALLVQTNQAYIGTAPFIFTRDTTVSTMVAHSAWFDSVHAKYYVILPQIPDGGKIRIYRYSVNC